MTLAYWMVLVAAMLPYIAVGYAKLRPNYNNHAPRVGIEQLPPAKQRAYWAHLNAFEAFPPFAAAVIIAHQLQASQGRVDVLALAFVVLRLLYVAAYVANKANLRSVIWMLAVLANVAILFAGFR